MLLFGAPEEQSPEKQAWSAIQAAFAMLHQNKELSERWQRDLSLELKVRVGINTGESTIGVFGSDLLKSYTAVGSAVNIASRLEGESMPGGILISRATYDLIKGQVKAQPRGRIKLKGVLDPVEAWDMVSLTK
jgi:class 3 adenylate cyclase